VQFPITSRVNFSPQLSLSQRGFSGKTIFSDSAYTKRSITTQYLDVSPNFEFKLGNLSEFGTTFSIWGGPYLGIGLWDNSTYERRAQTLSGSFATTTTTGESFSREIRRLDGGIKLGIGVITQNFVSFGLTYQTGLMNISTEPGELRNQSLGFYMRVFFDEIL
jgi:Outer membrane protein beta-barrel domain